MGGKLKIIPLKRLNEKEREKNIENCRSKDPLVTE